MLFPYDRSVYHCCNMNRQGNGADAISERICFELITRRVLAPEVARLLGRDVKTIRRRLRGETPWPMSEVWLLAEHLNIPVAELTGVCAA